MTGFLASLAARSTGQERVLEPRRLLFEPREEPPLDAGVSSGVEPVAEPSLSPAPPVPPERTNTQPAAAAESPLAAAREAPGDDGPTAGRATSAPRLRQRRAARPAYADEPPVSRRELLRPESRPLHPAAPVQPNAPRHTLPTRAAAPRPVRAELAERPARRHVLRSPPPVAAGSPAGADVVRITIGRVDVRAVQAPEEKTPTPRAKAPPRMSLEEYLARGQRR